MAFEYGETARVGFSSESGPRSKWESVSEKIRPSVVKINVFSSLESVNPENPSEKKGRAWVKAGHGSGFFVSADGYIVTNRHVAYGPEGERRHSVVLSDGSELACRIVTIDPARDLALLKVEGAGNRTFKPVELAAKGSVRQGQSVLVMGSPLTVDNAVAVGTVSALGHEKGTKTKVIATDTDIHPGNSGGVMVNDRGQVIGINTFGIISEVGSGSIGHAISSEEIQGLVSHKEFFAQFYYHFYSTMYSRLDPENPLPMKQAFENLIASFKAVHATFYASKTQSEQVTIQNELLDDSGIMFCFHHITRGCRKPEMYDELFMQAFGRKLFS